MQQWTLTGLSPDDPRNPERPALASSEADVEGGRFIVNGIEVNAFGKPVGTPLDSDDKDLEIQRQRAIINGLLRGLTLQQAEAEAAAVLTSGATTPAPAVPVQPSPVPHVMPGNPAASVPPPPSAGGPTIAAPPPPAPPTQPTAPQQPQQPQPQPTAQQLPQPQPVAQQLPQQPTQ